MSPFCSTPCAWPALAWPLSPPLRGAGRAEASEPQSARQACQQAVAGARRAASGWLALPFDALRAQYDAAVRLGLVRRSMLDAREVERTLGALESLTLGTLARRV